MHPEETPDAPPTEGQTIPPEEQIIPTAGLVQEDEQTQTAPETQDAPESNGAPESPAAAARQAQSLARENPMPIAVAAAFVAGVVIGRIASRR